MELNLNDLMIIRGELGVRIMHIKESIANYGNDYGDIDHLKEISETQMKIKQIIKES